MFRRCRHNRVAITAHLVSLLMCHQCLAVSTWLRQNHQSAARVERLRRLQKFSFRTLNQQNSLGCSVNVIFLKLKHFWDVLKLKRKNILPLGTEMNADVMLAQDSDQEKPVSSHCEGDVDTWMQQLMHMPLLAVVEGLKTDKKTKKCKTKKNLPQNCWKKKHPGFNLKCLLKLSF